MKELIECLERATEDQQQELLTEAVYAAVHHGWLKPETAERAFRFIEVGAFESAAKLFVPEVCAWSISRDLSYACEAIVYGHDLHESGDAEAPALALCIAGLRAQEAVKAVQGEK